MQTDTHTCIVL